MPDLLLYPSQSVFIKGVNDVKSDNIIRFSMFINFVRSFNLPLEYMITNNDFHVLNLKPKDFGDFMNRIDFCKWREICTLSFSPRDVVITFKLK